MKSIKANIVLASTPINPATCETKIGVKQKFKISFNTHDEIKII
jgi:hypothetical protein